MVVVTDKSFLQGAGRSTLLGQLCRTWSRHHDTCWIDSKAMVNNSGALPGLPVPAPSSRPNGMHSHNLSGRTTMPPRNPPSQTQTRTQTRTYQDQVSPLARETLSPSLVRLRIVLGLPDPSNYQRRAGSGGRGHGHGGAHWQSAARVVRRDLDNDEFPSLQPLATALDSTQSSRQRSRKPEGRK
jgi:hypothetical protein